MPKKQCAVAILAAGKGTRLKLEKIPKALAPVLGLGLIDFVLEPLMSFYQKCSITPHIGAVVGHHREILEDYLKNRYKNEFDKGLLHTSFQKEQKGTGHALQVYLENESSLDYEYTIVTCADTPLIDSEVYEKIYQQISSDKDLKAIVVSFEAQDPKGYGRIIKDPKKGLKIVEQKDASRDELLIKEVNSGVYIFKTSYIKEHINKLTNDNNSGEFYLTDLFKTEENVKAFYYKEGSQFLGVNDTNQLETARKVLQKEKILSLQKEGVYFEAPDTCFIDWEVSIEKGSSIGPNAYIKGKTEIAQNVSLEANTIIKNSKISKDASVFGFSHLESSFVGEGCTVGPFARLRPETILEKKSKVGNFVEIKKSTLKAGAKASHLSYIGDASIGENTNIGCGFITCNYDGANKHKTLIGKDCFIGSDTQAIAPVEIGDASFIAAGSTITNNVPSGGFAIARSKQVTKEEMAQKFIKKKDS